MALSKLIDLAQGAIDDVFSDRSVKPQRTLDALSDLRSFIDFKMEAIKADMKRKEVEGRGRG